MTPALVCPRHHRPRDGPQKGVRAELRQFVQAVAGPSVRSVIACCRRPLETVPESTAASSGSKVRQDYPTEARIKQKQREAEFGKKTLPKKMDNYEKHWDDCGDDLSSISVGGPAAWSDERSYDAYQHAD